MILLKNCFHILQADNDRSFEGFDVLVKDNLRVKEKYHDSSDFSMRRVVLAHCSPFSVTEGLLRKSAGLAGEQGVRIHTHPAETADDDEIKMLAETQTSIAHCPSSNMRLGRGHGAFQHQKARVRRISVGPGVRTCFCGYQSPG